MDNRLSIVTISCDKYVDIVEYFLFYLHKHWPDCEYKIYVAEEEHDLHSTVAETILCGKDTSWTKGAIKAISSVNSPYILLTNDDYYIYEDIDGAEIRKVVDFVEENKIKYYRFPHALQTGKYKMYKDNPNVEMIPRNRAYGITIGTSIWERNEILRILGDGTKTAWDLENDFSKAAAEGKPGEYYTDYVSDRRNLLKYVHMATWGKWLPNAVRVMTEHGHSEIDYSIRGFVPQSGIIKFRIYGIATKIIPAKLRHPIKNALSKVGFKFATKW